MCQHTHSKWHASRGSPKATKPPKPPKPTDLLLTTRGSCLSTNTPFLFPPIAVPSSNLLALIPKSTSTPQTSPSQFFKSNLVWFWYRTLGIMQVSMMVSGNKEQASQIGSTDKDMDADIRQPSINTEPRTLNDMKMERAMVTAQKIYAKHPSEDFTKDAVDTATRENAPAEDAGDANLLGKHSDGLVQNAGDLVDTNFTQSKASLSTEAPATPPATTKPHRPNSDPN